jgi:hypothetical protein
MRFLRVSFHLYGLDVHLVQMQTNLSISLEKVYLVAQIQIKNKATYKSIVDKADLFR